MSGNVKFNGWINDDGSENYKCRAWVNFNGTGTVAIRASGNVSSITDNGVGDYTVNFATAMLDDNYIFAGSTVWQDNFPGNVCAVSLRGSYTPVASGARFVNTIGNYSAGALSDSAFIYVTFFR
jgi:hypothetical protein